MTDEIKTTRITLSDGENLWDKLKAKTPLLAYTEQELIRNAEILAYIAQINNIWDFRAIPVGTLTVPVRACRQAVVELVRSRPDVYRNGLAAVAEDRALGSS